MQGTIMTFKINCIEDYKMRNHILFPGWRLRIIHIRNVQMLEIWSLVLGDPS